MPQSYGQSKKPSILMKEIMKTMNTMNDIYEKTTYRVLVSG